MVCFVCLTCKSANYKLITVRTYSDLYRLYQAEAFAQGNPAASASTFFRTLRASSWRNKIKFRHASNHAQCAVCHRLKSRIKTARTLHTHAKFADEYMRHLSGIYADRQVYSQYKLRSTNQRDIINLIVDSMDRSKFKLPRWPGGRCPKSMETRKRPDMELTAVLCHGRALFVFLTDEDATTGSDWSLEVLSLSLNRLFSMAQQNNEPWPAHLRIWTDNTPKETGTEVHFEEFVCQFLFCVGFKFLVSVSFPTMVEILQRSTATPSLDVIAAISVQRKSSRVWPTTIWSWVTHMKI